MIYYALKKEEPNPDSYQKIEDEILNNEEKSKDNHINKSVSTHKRNSRSSRKKSFAEEIDDRILEEMNPEHYMSMGYPAHHHHHHARNSAGDNETPDLDFENAAAHELLPNSIYYPVTIISFALVVGSACFIKDVEIVVKFAGSLGNAILNYLIPGSTYYLIMRKYEREKTPKWKLYSALFLAIYAGVLALILTGVNVWTTIDP